MAVYAFCRMAAAAVAAILLVTPAHADAACKQFAWSLDEERSRFDSASLKALDGEPGGPWRSGWAYRVAVKPADTLAYRLPPERQPKAEANFGTVMSFAAVEQPGRFQVTLSDEAWIDVIQDAQYLKAVEHAGVKGCAGLRKSVRFVLKEGPVVLQVSGTAAASLDVAIRKVD